MLIEYCAGLGRRAGLGTRESWPSDSRPADAAMDDAGADQTVPRRPSPTRRFVTLARHALEIERAFGAPQDIEWTIDDRRARCGSCRAGRSPRPHGPRSAARSGRLVERQRQRELPAPISPLLYSIARTGYYHYFRNLGRAFGFSLAPDRGDGATRCATSSASTARGCTTTSPASTGFCARRRSASCLPAGSTSSWGRKTPIRRRVRAIARTPGPWLTQIAELARHRCLARRGNTSSSRDEWRVSSGRWTPSPTARTRIACGMRPRHDLLGRPPRLRRHPQQPVDRCVARRHRGDGLLRRAAACARAAVPAADQRGPAQLPAQGAARRCRAACRR